MPNFIISIRKMNNTRWFLVLNTETNRSVEYPEFYIKNIVDSLQNATLQNGCIVGSTGDLSRYTGEAVTVLSRIDKDGDISYKCVDCRGSIFIVDTNSTGIYTFTNACKLKNGRLRGINWEIPTEIRHYKIYLLMNKDTPVCKFKDYTKISSTTGKFPYDFIDLKSWIDIRSKFSCAHNVKEFFKRIGINTAEDFIDIFHCVSLSDTFWLKEYSSKLRWKDVSPFNRDYSSLISNYALEGKIPDVVDKTKNYFSPDVATGGSFPHTWKRSKNGTIWFIKGSSKFTLGGRNSGQEPISEYYASKICDILGMNHISYGLRIHKRIDGNKDYITYCKCYTSESTGSVPASSLGLLSYKDVLLYSKSLSESAFNTATDMFFLDCLLLNADRHFNNIEFFMDNDTLQIKDIVPIYDNNYSLLPRFLEGVDVFSRNEYNFTRDGNTTFEDLFNLILKYNRKRCISLLSKSAKIQLKQPDNCSIPEERLSFLNNFIKIQVNWLQSLAINNRRC